MLWKFPEEPDQAFALDRIKPEMSRQRGNRGPRRFQCGEDVALNRAGQAGGVDARLRKPGAQTEVADKGCQ